MHVALKLQRRMEILEQHVLPTPIIHHRSFESPPIRKSKIPSPELST